MNKNEIKMLIYQITSEIKKEEIILENENISFFKQVDFSSLEALMFYIELEKEMNKKLNIMEFDPQFTLNQLVDYLAS